MDTIGLGLTHTLWVVLKPRHKRRRGAKVLQNPRSAEDCEEVGLPEAAWNDNVNDQLFASLVLILSTPRCLGHYTCFLVPCVGEDSRQRRHERG